MVTFKDFVWEHKYDEIKDKSTTKLVKLDYPIEIIDMTDNQKVFFEKLDLIRAGDGDDYAEDVARGFELAIDQFK